VEQVLSHLPPGASLYAVGDNHFFPLLYFHLVEGQRSDLTLFPEWNGNKALASSLENRLYSTLHEY
jgi:hypothetical protein